jgi:hypothetical protein
LVKASREEAIRTDQSEVETEEVVLADKEEVIDSVETAQEEAVEEASEAEATEEVIEAVEEALKESQNQRN